MNQQPSEIISSINAFIFICMVFYFLITRKQTSTTNDGFFKIGYIEEPAPCQQTIVFNNKTEPEKEIPVEKTSLFSDCVDALVSLGFRKAMARNLTKSIFRKHKPTNIQQFLHLAINNK